jgi:dipeptidyl aminopeptidase/acylaminoacyl peptidase
MGGGMQPIDIGALRAADDPRLSPDGSAVAFVVASVDLDANDYRSEVCIVPVDGSAEPRLVSEAGGRCARPRWAPDGSALAWVQREDDDLFALLVDGQAVATWPEDIEDSAWSPDGTRLAFLARLRDEAVYGPDDDKDRPPRRIDRLAFRLDNVGWTIDRPRRLFVVPADGSAPPRALTDGPFEDGRGLSWSPDGTRIAFTSGRHEGWDLDQVTDVFTVDVATGELHRLTDTTQACAKPSWSPDGARIAFHRWNPHVQPSHAQVAVLDTTSGAVEVLTATLDRQCAPYLGQTREPQWDGPDVLFQVEDAGAVHLYRAPGDGTGKPERLLGGNRTITCFDVAEGVLVHAAEHPLSPAELFVGDRALTAVAADFRRRVDLIEPERFTATAPDGAEVEAWIMRPAGWEPGRRYPTLLDVHGGPFTQYGYRFLDELQMQAGAGFAVVFCNPRGSSGYTESWGRAIRGPKAAVDPGSGWGGVDADDLLAVVDEAVRRFDFVDADRLGVLGGSYGGFMTTWLLARSDRFKAGSSARAVNNLLTMESGSDLATQFSRHVGVSHLDDPEEDRKSTRLNSSHNR